MPLQDQERDGSPGGWLVAAEPVLVTSPADDDMFRAHARATIRTGMTAEQLALGLRGRYPDVVVRQRGLSAEPFRILYVYRDGRWVGAGTPVERA